MGTLREQGTPFLGQRTSFQAAYPTVKRAYMKYTETEFGDDPRTGVHDFSNSPRFPCRNSSCRRGGYDFENDIMFMVSQGLKSKTVDVSCPGDEGSPKGRNKGRSCLMSIEGEITIEYKEAVSPAIDDGALRV